MALPSEYLSPSRRVYVYVLPSELIFGWSFAAAGLTFPVVTSAVMSGSNTLMLTPISFTNDSTCGSMVSGSALILVVSSPLGSAWSPPPLALGPPPVCVQAPTTNARSVMSDKSGQMRLRVWVKIPPPSPFLLGYGAILGHPQYRR